MIDQDTSDPFGDRLRTPDPRFGPAARRVLAYLDANRAKVLASSALDIAACTGTSDATVVRTVQALGYAGLGAFKQALADALEHVSNPSRDMRRTLEEIGGSASRAVEAVFEAHDEALTVLRSPEGKTRIVAAASNLHSAERIVVFGIGPSAALARYASVLLARTGRRSLALTHTGLTLADEMLDLRSGDAVLGLAYGRPYREVSALFAEAHRLGLRTVLITDGREPRLSRLADTVIVVPRGRAERVALHGATLVALEALVLGLAVNNTPVAITTLDRLNGLRQTITGQRRDAI